MKNAIIECEKGKIRGAQLFYFYFLLLKETVK